MGVCQMSRAGLIALLAVLLAIIIAAVMGDVVGGPSASEGLRVSARSRSESR